MLTSTIDIENTDGVSNYSMNNDSGGSGFSPISDVDVQVVDRSDGGQGSNFRYKLQASGAWPTRSYEGEMTIHIEGNLFGDTQEDYWTERQSLLTACRGVPGANITDYKRGTIFITPAGSTERWSADFGPFTYSAPVQALLGTGTPILLTLTSWTPYFIGETSGDFFWWS